MDTFRWIIRTKSSWGYVFAALFALLGAIVPFPVFGVVSFALTILTLYLQGSEAVRARNELDLRHTRVLQEIEEARKVAASQHDQALQEIQQARAETATRHAEALREIEEARKDAARQYEEAAQEIKKAHAERFLLEAEKLATSLVEKDELVNEAIRLYPDFRQRELRQLGAEMSAAVIGNEDYLKWKSMQAILLSQRQPIFTIPLEEEERTYFIEHAILYLTETELQSANANEVGLVYLACMYGYCHQYDDMMLVLDRARQIGPVIQMMKDQYRDQPMLTILVNACSSDSFKLERLREILALPQPTEEAFCTYIRQEYPQTPHYKEHGENSQWIAVRRREVPGEMKADSVIIWITPEIENPHQAGAYAFYWPPQGGLRRDIVPSDNKVPLEELYRTLSDLFILFAPLDGVYLYAGRKPPKPMLWG